MIVTSAAVPEVVGTAIVKTAGFFVAATPSSERTSANFGLVTMMPMALAVSIEEPPPMATMQSAFAALNALTPALTFSIVGLGLMSEKISNLIPAFFSRSVTFAVVPIFTRTGSDATKTFLKPPSLIRPGISAIAPFPWKETPLRLMR